MSKIKLLNGVHHIAIICSNYAVSKHFYTDILGLEIIREVYREERQSYKLDLRVDKHTQIELFSFINPPSRVSRPEACGLRHLAFRVNDLSLVVRHLEHNAIIVEPIRVDEYTGKSFTFFADPDGLPIELYQEKLI